VEGRSLVELASPRSPIRAPQRFARFFSGGGEEDFELLLSVAMEQSVVESVRAQKAVVSKVFRHLMFDKFGLRQHLEALRRYMLMDGAFGAFWRGGGGGGGGGARSSRGAAQPAT
jgi:hypothetical protein